MCNTCVGYTPVLQACVLQVFTHTLQLYELHVQYTYNTAHILHAHHTCNIQVTPLPV